MTPQDREQIRKELGEISPWPWRPGKPLDGTTYIGTGTNIENGYNFGVRNCDAYFIAQAPARIAALLDEVERLEKELEVAIHDKDTNYAAGFRWKEIAMEAEKQNKEIIEQRDSYYVRARSAEDRIKELEKLK